MTPSGAKLLAVILACGCAGIWLSLPRPVPPYEPPSLTLDGAAVQRVLATDRRGAGDAPRGEAVFALEALIREQGRAELGPGETPTAFQGRRAALERTAARVTREHGPNALAALRARATERLPQALAGGLEEDERDALLGTFPRMLERYDLVVNGERLAPPFVVRTLFKARWNGIVGLDLTAGLAPVERRAYWGWLALHAASAPIAMRQGALDAYAAAGGSRVAEARAVLSYREGDVERAAHWMGRAHAQHGGLRLRNHALATLP